MSAERPSEVLERVERQLRELWTAPPAPGEPPMIRVTTMNLVVVGSREIMDRYVTIVDDVTKSTPARAVLLALSPDARASSLEADVSAVCSIDGDKKSTCSERVRLWAEGDLCARMASAAAALLVPELPTALVWLGKVHVQDPVFAGLAAEANRVVLDTEYTSVQSVVSLAQWSQATPGRPAIADLSWTRLGAWRELLARFFDGPRTVGFAERIKAVHVRQVGEEHAAIGPEAALLLGWLASRLKWRARTVGGTLRFEGPGGAGIDVRLGTVARPAGVAPLALAYVSLEAEHEGETLHGTVARDLATGLEGATPDADVLSWTCSVGQAPPVERCVRLGANKGARLLERTLHSPASDPSLMEAARFAQIIVDHSLASLLP